MKKALGILAIGGIVGGGALLASRWRRRHGAAYNMDFGQPTPFLDNDNDIRYIVEQLHPFCRFAPKLFDTIVTHMECLCKAFAKARGKTPDFTSQPKVALKSESALEHILPKFEKAVKANGRGFPELMVSWNDRFQSLKDAISDTCYNTQNAVHEHMLYILQ